MDKRKTYLAVKSRAYQSVVGLFTEKPNLKNDVLEFASKKYSKDALIELAFLWDRESGFEHGSMGCYRFHVILNLSALDRGEEENALMIAVSHVPQTDNGYDWNVDELHVHPAEPFKHRPYDCYWFMKFLGNLQNRSYLERTIRSLIKTTDGQREPAFVERLEIASEKRRRKLIAKERI